MGERLITKKTKKEKVLSLFECILFYGSCVLILSILCMDVFFFFIDYFVIFISNLLWVYVLPLIMIVLLIDLIIYSFVALQTNSFKAKRIFVIFLVGLFVLFGRGFFSTSGMFLYYTYHHNTLNEFVTDILSDRKIWHMSDCQRYSKRVNDYYINNDMEKEYGGYYDFFVDSLKKDNISSERFDRYVETLSDVNLISFEIQNNYIAFTYDGFLDNEIGFLYIIDGAPPVLGTDGILGWGGLLVNLVHIRDNWYFFAVT